MALFLLDFDDFLSSDKIAFRAIVLQYNLTGLAFFCWVH